MANLLNFKFGEYSKLPENKAAGTVYITTDEQAMYVDLPKKDAQGTEKLTRLRIGDIRVFESASDEKFTPPYEVGFYYFISDNALMRYDSNKTWTQVNQVADIKENLAGLAETVDTLSDDLAAEISRSTGKDNAHDAAIAQLEKDVVKAQGDATKGIADAAAAKSAADDAQEDATQALKDAAAAQKAADDANAEAEAAKSAADKAQEDAGKAQARADSAHTEIGKTNTELAGVKSTATTAASDATKALANAKTAQEAAEEADAKALEAQRIANTKVDANDVATALTPYAKTADVNAAISNIQGATNETIASAYSLANTAKQAADTAQQAAEAADTKAGAAKTRADDAHVEIGKTNTELAGVKTTANRADENATQALADAAQGIADAANAASAAATAQQAAENAGAAAGKAQQDATQALTNAAAAQTRADNAHTAIGETNSKLSTVEETANRADGNASQALTNAATAQAAAEAAQATADKKVNADYVTSALAPYATTEQVNSKISDIQGDTDQTIAAAYSLADTANQAAEDAQEAAETAQQAAEDAQATADSKVDADYVTSALAPYATQEWTSNEIDKKIQTIDAMTYKGVVDCGSDLASTPNPANANANKGDVWKVGRTGTYAKSGNFKGIDAKVGDLLIYEGADGTNDPSKWAHVSSGYEDDYLQKFKVVGKSAVAGTETIPGTNRGVVMNLTDGVGENSNNLISEVTFLGAGDSNIHFDVSTVNNKPVVTATMEWGTFN